MTDSTLNREERGTALRVVNLRKSYGEVEVLRGIDMTVESGQVHALLGSNGAGKSTLLGCLSGAVTPSDGSFIIDGVEYSEISPSTSLATGIATIYQHFQLISSLSVADNVFLGSEARIGFGRIDKKAQGEKTQEILAQLGSSLSPQALVGDLNPGEMQLVEIARALRHDPKVLILDEPTAALSDREVEALLELVRRLASRGIAIIYVTHLLDEIFRVANIVTVLRDGQRLWTRSIDSLSYEDVVEAIAPQSSTKQEPDAPSEVGKVIAELNEYRGSLMGPLNMEVRGGEIIGVFGLMGSGRTDLLESMAGVRKGGDGLWVDNVPVNPGSIRAARQAGIALVPEDRKAEGLFTGMSALDNVLLPHLQDHLVRSSRREIGTFLGVARDVGVYPIAPSLSIDYFSGGNAQKLVVARWLLDKNLRVLLIDEPTQGVDIGARGDLYRLLRKYVRSDNRAVIFATSDPEEALLLADRIIVLCRGRVTEVLSGVVTETELLAMAHAHETSETGKL